MVSPPPQARPPASGAAGRADPSRPRPSPSSGAVAEGQPEDGGGELRRSGFQVRLDVFEGPFDLLLGLIAKHKLDVTEVALSKVTDDFIGHIRDRGGDWELGQATEFLVIAATLLDLKAARLLPTAEVEDEEDLALLEVRDLLFARLLQYRAYKRVATLLAERFATESRRFPRTVGLEPRFAGLLPRVLIGLGPQQFAALAARALAPKPPPAVAVSHLHMPRVSVREQAAWLMVRLRRLRRASFAVLVADCLDTLTVVARFLALLELFREGAVSFEQDTPLGELTVCWTGAEAGQLELAEEFDEEFDGEFDEDRAASADGTDTERVEDR